MKLTLTMFMVLAFGVTGCASHTARRVAELADYHATDEDRHEQDKAFEEVDAIAKEHLTLGMTESQVRPIMGRPMFGDGTEPSRVHIWTYLLSYSCTWTYSVAFLDGRVVYFGTLNPQWIGHPSYDGQTEPGIKMIHEIRKNEIAAEHAGGG